MNSSDHQAFAAHTARLRELESERAVLLNELECSLALQALVPDVFEGGGAARTQIIGNLIHAPLKALYRVTKANGAVVDLPLPDVPWELWTQSARNDFREGGAKRIRRFVPKRLRP